MTIKIETLRCFSTVAQCGNLADAANQLSRTQSALSMTLKQLESDIGQRLFESDRKKSLTPLGEQVFELAQQQLRLFDSTISAMHAAAEFPKGLIRIASVPSVASVLFPSAIRTLTENHPGLKVELQDADTQRVINALIQGQADFGIVSGDYTLNGIKSFPLFEDRFGLICSPQHPLAKQTQSPTIDDIASAAFVGNNLCSAIDSAEFQVALSQARVTVYNTLSLIGMIRTQNWVTVLPQQVAQIFPDELTFRTIDSIKVMRPVYALINQRSAALPYAEDLAAIVCKHDWRHL